MSSTSSNTSKPKTPQILRPSKFVEHIFDLERSTSSAYRVENKDRGEMVEKKMDEWRQQNPRIWNKLDWEARCKIDTNGEYREFVDNTVETTETSTETKTETVSKTTTESLHISPMKTLQSSVAQRLASAKKVFCLGGGSISPDDSFVKSDKKIKAECNAFWES